MLLKNLPKKVQSIILSYHDIEQVLLMEALYDVWMVPPAVVKRATAEANETKEYAVI